MVVYNLRRKNLTPLEQRNIAIPIINGEYDKCHMYNMYHSNNDILEISDGFPHSSLLQNSSLSIIPCPNGWNYDTTYYDNTLVTQFSLVCDNAWWPSFSTTLFYLGSLVGNILLGWVSDRWGRRFAFFCVLFPDVLLSVATAFSPNYLVFTILRTFSGMCFPALYQVSFILALELMGPRYRTMVGMMMTICFALSMSLLAILGYILRDWASLSLATSVPFVILFSYYWIIPESPRWLLSKNKIDEAEKIVQKIAETNKKPIPVNFLHRLMEGSSTLTNSSETRLESSKVVTPIEILKYPKIRLRFLILSFNWIANAVVYNGLSFNVTNLGIGDHHAFLIGGLIEVPSHLITWYLMDHWGRRPVLCIMMFFGGLSCVSSLFISGNNTWLTLLLAMIGKFGNAASFGVFYVFVGELLPTVIRSQAMGIAGFIAGVGLLGFPYIIRLGEYNKVYPLVVMGFLSLSGGIMSLFLPETLRISLPQTLEDGEAMKADIPLLSKIMQNKNRKKSESRNTKEMELCNGTELEELCPSAGRQVNSDITSNS
ncbi:organic cation transporter 1-like isoform X2 [Lycorma delicatula]|uniref:organic cation transporter 1-like isoform X2 n=1 Tax=Lycorma delicatula TaxID=130591 RepID=UPI003F517BEE